jgi:spermidine synthase
VIRLDNRLRIGKDDGQRALLVDGVVQSVAVEPTGEVVGYWSALLPDRRPRRALVLGLGGGTLVHLLHRRFGPLPVFGVEMDAEVLETARRAFGLDLPLLTVVEQDAFVYVERCDDRFDYICVDLFRGGQLDGRIVGRPFLRQLRKLAMPGAEITINLFQDRRSQTRLQRLARVLSVRSTEVVGKNLVVRLVSRQSAEQTAPRSARASIY